MAKLVMTIGTNPIGIKYIRIDFRIDEEKAEKARNTMVSKKVIYGHSVPYRNMCRFNSGVG
jgi:hypothetical protein